MTQAQPDGTTDPGVVLVRRLADISPSVASLLQEHLEDNDEVLPTLFLGEVEKWFERAYRRRESAPETFIEAKAVGRALGDAFSKGDDTTRNFIAVGFVEMLPNQVQEERACIEELPDSLRNELQRMESWSPRE